MTLRQMEKEIWREVAASQGISAEQVDAAVAAASSASDLMDIEIPTADEAYVRAQMRKVIFDTLTLKEQRN